MQCPNCWRPISFDEKYAKVISCHYCNSILEFGWWELTKSWEQWFFIEFPSQFVVWKETDFNWKKIYVKWQLRYEYDGGFFDDFFCVSDWKSFYIREDDWVISEILASKFEKNELNLWEKIASENFEFNWKKFFIEETWFFKLVNIKWFVDDVLLPWKEYFYLTWISKWKKYFFEKDETNWKIRILQEI